MTSKNDQGVQGTTAVRDLVQEFRMYAKHPIKGSEFVPIHQSTLLQAAKDIEQLRALVTRLTNAAENLAREVPDPGTEALAAIHCGRHFIYG